MCTKILKYYFSEVPKKENLEAFELDNSSKASFRISILLGLV